MELVANTKNKWLSSSFESFSSSLSSFSLFGDHSYPLSHCTCIVWCFWSSLTQLLFSFVICVIIVKWAIIFIICVIVVFVYTLSRESQFLVSESTDAHCIKFVEPLVLMLCKPVKLRSLFLVIFIIL